MESSINRARVLMSENKYSEANEILVELTYRGSVQATTLLAENNFYGRGVEADRETAYVILTSAIERTQNLGLIEFLVLLRTIDHERINAEYDEKAKKEFFEETFNYLIYASFNNSNNPNIYFTLGTFYETGTGTEINLESAQDNYKRAAEICYQDVQNNFDLFINSGFRLGRLQLNFEQALKDGVNNIINCSQYLNVAKVYAGRIFYEGKLIEKDYSKAFDYFQNAAKAGILEAQFYLAEMYENGIPNVCEKNLNKAIDLYFAVAMNLVNRGKCIIECLPPLATSEEYCVPIEKRSIEKLKIHRPQLLEIVEKNKQKCLKEKCTRCFTKNQAIMQHAFYTINYPGNSTNNCTCLNCMQKCYDGYSLMDFGIIPSICNCKCSNNK